MRGMQRVGAREELTFNAVARDARLSHLRLRTNESDFDFATLFVATEVTIIEIIFPYTQMKRISCQILITDQNFQQSSCNTQKLIKKISKKVKFFKLHYCEMFFYKIFL